MTTIGQFNTLEVLSENHHGFYLDGGSTYGAILLPGNRAPKDLRLGQSISVFLYMDSEDRLVATTEKPFATINQFAALEVVALHGNHGAFLNWGLIKDLLLPYKEQSQPVSVGDTVVVRVLFDERSDRIIATSKIHSYLSTEPPPYETSEEVDAIVISRTPLGFNAIINNNHLGLFYHTNLSIPLKIGQTTKAYIRTIRPDGKIDLSLDRTDKGRIHSIIDDILIALKENNGFIPFDDYSDPEKIRETFNTSKKAFKKALSTLYKERQVEFPKSGGTQKI